MILDFLVCFEHACIWIQKQWDQQKQYVRSWLGPPPQDYYLLENGDILPIGIQLPSHIQSYLYFSKSNNVIYGPDREERLSRLPWLTMEHKCDGITTDLTEVISEIRHSKHSIPSLLQIVRLAALIRNEYLSESYAQLLITSNMGEEEVYVYKNTTNLELQ